MWTIGAIRFEIVEGRIEAGQFHGARDQGRTNPDYVLGIALLGPTPRSLRRPGASRSLPKSLPRLTSSLGVGDLEPRDTLSRGCR
jgi:hypothetical protein